MHGETRARSDDSAAVAAISLNERSLRLIVGVSGESGDGMRQGGSETAVAVVQQEQG
jgi:hypothetical protein